MLKFKTCNSFLIAVFVVAILVLVSLCVECSDEAFKFVPTDADVQARKIITDTFTEWANKGEVALDGWRTWYCQEFQSHFYQNATAWPTVWAQCIDPLVFNPSSQRESFDELPIIDPVMKAKVNTKVLELHAKCAHLVENPCIEDDWFNVKMCVRDEYMSIPYDSFGLFLNYESLLIERALVGVVFMDSGISKCTYRTLMAPSGQ